MFQVCRRSDAHHELLGRLLLGRHLCPRRARSDLQPHGDDHPASHDCALDVIFYPFNAGPDTRFDTCTSDVEAAVSSRSIHPVPVAWTSNVEPSSLELYFFGGHSTIHDAESAHGIPSEPDDVEHGEHVHHASGAFQWGPRQWHPALHASSDANAIGGDSEQVGTRGRRLGQERIQHPAWF